jgi:hypothetical protein
VFAMLYKNCPVENYSLSVENLWKTIKTLGELAHGGVDNSEELWYNYTA